MGTTDKTLEQIAIEDKRSHVVRWLLFLAAILGFLFVNYTFFRPIKKPKFDALNSLAHEAILFEERAEADPRLDYPAKTIADISQFLRKEPELGFNPYPLDFSTHGWHVEGTSILEYDRVKIAVVQHTHLQQHSRVYQFIFQGELAKLPVAATATLGSLTYQAYGSKEMNLIAWQDGPLLSFLAGRSSVLDLAELASHGVAVH